MKYCLSVLLWILQIFFQSNRFKEHLQEAASRDKKLLIPQTATFLQI